MINLILHYLLALPDTISPETSQASIRTSVSAARKRKSMDLLTMMAEKSDLVATPLLFNLVDLILACLRSQNQQTIHVTLQLVSAILKRHHRYAVITLLRTEGVHSNTAHRTIGAHQQEVEFLMALAGNVGGQDNFNEIYENVLKDTMMRLESHPCSLKLVAPKVSTNNHKLPAIPDSLPGAPRDVRVHTIRPDDRVLNTILDLLQTFFVNPVETNLSVTETIVDLAICGYVHVEGWLLRHPHKYTYDEEINSPSSPDAPMMSFASILPPDPESPSYAEFQKLQSMGSCRRRPKWTSASLPRMLAIMQQLSDQVSKYRETIPRFDDLVQQRREAFQTADSGIPTPVAPRKGTPLQQSSTATPTRASLDEITRSGSPARPSGLEGFAQRLLGELGSPSRSNSPRGRKELTPNSAGGTGMMSGGYGLATPTAISGSKSIPIAPPREFPVNYESGGRPGIARSYSPGSAASGSARDDTGSSFGGRDAVASQAAAFAAVDQSILARRVGIPGKVEPIPLTFDKKAMDVDATPTKSTASARGAQTPDGTESEASLPPGKGEAPTPQEERTVSVSHVVTNVIILQSFLFELASLIQVRAGLFDEVRFA
jgi:hypothetical protein